MHHRATDITAARKLPNRIWPIIHAATSSGRSPRLVAAVLLAAFDSIFHIAWPRPPVGCRTSDPVRDP